jgi:hypothetical protein
MTMKASTKRKAKGAVKSKVVVGNAVAIGAVVVDALANSGGLIAALGGGPAAVAGIAFINMVLRGFTSQSLEDKGY